MSLYDSHNVNPAPALPWPVSEHPRQLLEVSVMAYEPKTGDRVTYRGLPHTVTSVKLATIAGPHVRMSCEAGCPKNCDAGELTSVYLITPERAPSEP